MLTNLPETDKGVVIVLSGGMDSTIAMRLCVEKYGAEKVSAISFDYGQRQRVELIKAAESTKLLGVNHQVVDLSLLNKIAMGFSANVDTSIKMPTIKEVLGQPQPKTYVPNRNMIMMSIVAAYAETQGAEYIVTGLQVHDEYGYWDTTQRFVDAMNAVLAQNRITQIKIIAPFVDMSKTEELELLRGLDGNLNFLRYTMTCYNPISYIESEPTACGRCPSCAERIQSFLNIGEKDPIEYDRNDIPWAA
jgi:7-cyano-7-deazaguanine synthase